MSDAIGAMLASAGIAQSLFGESGGGIATRLQSALGLELARARVDADFAAAAVASAAFASSVERRAAASRLWPSLAGESADAARDSRVRVPGQSHDRRGDEREQEGRGCSEGADGSAAATTLPRWQLQAIERALQSARDAANAAGCSGALPGLVLPGTLAEGGDGSPACTVFVLCTSFDGDLGATRRVWGFGYADTVLAATLDGRRTEIDQPGEPPRTWIVERSSGVVESGHRSVVLTQGKARWVGLLLDDDPPDSMPERWQFLSPTGPLAC